jgi:methylmalonyl-CoA mutase N-terminal domain/subunit
MSDDRERWEQETYGAFLKRAPARDVRFESLSGFPIKPLYTSEDVTGSYAEKLGYPGEYPYTRGVYPTMYRGRLWTMRMFAGFGRPEDTNARFKYLLKEGQTGLSTAFDMPALMGYDADHPRARGEVGKEGVSISTLDDFERLFADIPLGDVTTSMTINCTASIALAMYLAIAEKQGVAWDRLGGTIQNDMLKEFIAQKEWICPPEPAVRIVTDMIEFTAKHVPKWNPVSISGYHIREAGSTAVQELAFTLADGLAYVEAALARGLDVDSFAPRLSFFFDVHNDFFEEIAKLRAARRLWARAMKERYGAKKPESMRLRTHTQTAGVSATAQQPLNNVARVALQALAAVLGGAQSLHTNSYDETWALPTEDAVTVALRTQQIIAEETGVALTIDPLGGSYYLESLTDRMEVAAAEYIATIDRMGGMVAAIDQGYPQKEIADAAYRYQLMEDRREKITVGVNKYVMADEKEIHFLKIDERVELDQIERTGRFKAARDLAKVERRLKQLGDACRNGQNVMPVLVDAVKDYASLGEISDVYRQVFGLYREPIIF